MEPALGTYDRCICTKVLTATPTDTKRKNDALFSHSGTPKIRSGEEGLTLTGISSWGKHLKSWVSGLWNDRHLSWIPVLAMSSWWEWGRLLQIGEVSSRISSSPLLPFSCDLPCDHSTSDHVFYTASSNNLSL